MVEYIFLVYFSVISKKMGPTCELFDVKYRYNNNEKMTKFSLDFKPRSIPSMRYDLLWNGFLRSVLSATPVVLLVGLHGRPIPFPI